jgi:beta-phosphoglucomutase family hydrolase
LIIDPARFEAFAFDLDGVVTKTAAVHAAAWKRLFDEVLEQHARGDAWVPFDLDRDYRAHVDGKPRRDGLRDFLASRGLVLPEGRSGDSSSTTIHGLAARKHRYVQEHLASHGVEVYEDAVALLRRARACEIRPAVVSASENCAAVLAAADLTGWFEVAVDGLDVVRLGLRGKPAPDSFLEAARRLAVEPARMVIFEDAIAGVEAGRAGNFGLVVGVDRGHDADALRRHGADVVVRSLAALEIVRGATEGVPP